MTTITLLSVQNFVYSVGVQRSVGLCSTRYHTRQACVTQQKNESKHMQVMVSVEYVCSVKYVILQQQHCDWHGYTSPVDFVCFYGPFINFITRDRRFF